MVHTSKTILIVAIILSGATPLFCAPIDARAGTDATNPGFMGTIYGLTNRSDSPTETEDTFRDGNPIYNASSVAPAYSGSLPRSDPSIPEIENQIDDGAISLQNIRKRELETRKGGEPTGTAEPIGLDIIGSLFSRTANTDDDNIMVRSNISSVIAELGGTIETVGLRELKAHKASANTADALLSSLSNRTTDTPFHAGPDPTDIPRSNPDIAIRRAMSKVDLAHAIQALNRRTLERELDPELRAHGGSAGVGATSGSSSSAFSDGKGVESREGHSPLGPPAARSAGVRR